MVFAIVFLAHIQQVQGLTVVLGGDLVGWHGTIWVKPLDDGRGEALSDVLQVPRLPLQGPRAAAGPGKPVGKRKHSFLWIMLLTASAQKSMGSC